MSGSHPHPSELNDRQRRIHRRLTDLVSFGTAKWFHNACRIMARPDEHHAASHLVAHCLREVESALRGALKAILEADPSKGSKSKDTHGTAEKGDTHEREVRAAAQFLGLATTHRAIEIWLSLSEGVLPRRAHRDNLLDPRPIDGEYLTWWEDVQHMLDQVLDRLEARFLDVLAPIERKLKVIPTPTLAQAQWFLKYVPNNFRAQQTALACCKSPEWLAALAEAGYFDRPPEIEPGEEPGYVRHPPWAAAEYLRELAPQAPDIVARIITAIAGRGNPQAQLQIVHVVLALPGPQAAAWSRAYISRPSTEVLDSALADALNKVIIHLASNGQPDAALELARHLFAVQRDTATVEQREKLGLPLVPDLRGRFELWHYEKNLSESTPALARASGISALEMFCSLLDQALQIRRLEGSGDGEDHSTIWRQTISGDGHLSHGPLNALVSAVRDTVELLLTEKRASLVDAFAVLERSKWSVFARIALHVLTTHPDFTRVERALHEWVATPFRDLEPEYYYLAEVQFASLADDVRTQLLSVIRVGPNPENVRKLLERARANAERFLGKTPPPVTDDDALRFIRDWRLRRLAAVRVSLPPELKSAYDELVREFERSGEPEPRVVVTQWEDTGNPEARKRLQRLTLRNLIGLLERAEGAAAVDGFVRDDLLTVLAQLIAADPTHFVAELARLRSLPPDVQRRALAGIGTARNEQRQVPWREVLQLCLALLDADSSSGAANSIVRLLQEALARGSKVPIPFSLRTELWEVLRRLMKHADPGSDRAHSRDPYSTAINSVRGTAMDAVISYAFWVRKGLIDAAGSPIPNSFELLPEVRNALESHLDPRIDPAPAVRSMYGANLWNLLTLDETWLRANFRRILSEQDATLFAAAWRAFVLVSHVPLDLIAELRPFYLREFGDLGSPTSEQSREYRRRLAGHVILYYWHGVVTLNDPLLADFFSKARPDVRGLAISAAGRMLYKEPRPSPDVLERLRALYDWRLDVNRTVAGIDDRRAELEGFGYWFASGHFDDDWSLERSTETLKIAGHVEADTLVAERAAQLAVTQPGRALTLADALVTGASTTWRIYAVRDELFTIVAQAKSSGNPDLIRRADELVNRMAARGVCSA